MRRRRKEKRKGECGEDGSEGGGTKEGSENVGMMEVEVDERKKGECWEDGRRGGGGRKEGGNYGESVIEKEEKEKR
ncbi:hypothetical protein Pmani_039039 [Petrolisthes manimaculis]|uniref:Uncharacterized protein n=1 Tax=Petrolisthes manimaculis TaxID=1843537 RepID=A0AAE1NEG5_9EUCA|nr:hypothetical protein Pmani_039039 [Petrolisthes manimaculis]